MSGILLPFKKGDNVIELGGGNNPIIHPNFDCRKIPNVDFVIDFNQTLPMSSNSYDGIYCKYALEHISWKNVKSFMSECFRLLKPGGLVIFITSNFLEQAKVLVNNPDKWCDNYIGMIFGGQDYNENAHQCGFSPQYITKILNEIGFKKVEISPIYSDFGPTDMIVQATK